MHCVDALCEEWGIDMVTFFITSTVMILAVLFIRFLLKDRVSFLILYPLWGVVLLRLLVPFTPLESPLSVMNLVEMAESALQRGEAGGQEDIKDSVKDGMKDVTKGDALQKQATEEKLQAESEKEASAQAPKKPAGEAAAEEKEGRSGKAGNEAIQKASAAAGQKGEAFTEDVRQDTPADMRKAGVVLWVSGSFLLLLCILVSNILFYRQLYRDRKPVDCRELPAASGQQGKQLQKQISGTGLPVYVTGRVHAPCLAGVLHPAIYLTPEVYEDKEHIWQVLVHEQMHACHKDYIWSVFRSLCLVVYWFDPFVWIAAACAKQDAEIACDEAALRGCTDEQRYDYGKMLIRMSRAKRQDRFCMVTSMGNGKWNLKERVTMLTKKRKRSLWQAAGMLILAGALAGCGMTKDKQNTESEVEEIERVNAGKQDARQQVSTVKKQETATGAAISGDEAGEPDITFTAHGDENEFYHDTLAMLDGCTKEVFDRVGPSSAETSTLQGPVRVTYIDHFLDDDSILYFVNSGYTMRSFVLRRGEKYDAYILDGSRWGKNARAQDMLSSAQPPDLLTPGGYFKLYRADFDKDGETEAAFHIHENPDTFIGYEVLYMFDDNGSGSYELYTYEKEDFRPQVENFCRQYNDFDEMYQFQVELSEVSGSKKNKVAGFLKDYDYVYEQQWMGTEDYIRYEFGHEAAYDIVLEDDKQEISVKIGILRDYAAKSKGTAEDGKPGVHYIQVRYVLKYQGNGMFVMRDETIVDEYK